MTMFRKAAMTSGPDPFLIRLASSRSVPSRTPCRPFSIPQCPRVSPSNPFTPARSGSRLVMPKTTSVPVFPLIVRSRVRRKTCSQPGQSDPRYPARDDVTSIVRFSTRPCPVSTSQARSTSASARAVWRGGKPSIRLSEGGRDVGTECRLVFLHGKDVAKEPIPGTIAVLELAFGRVDPRPKGGEVRVGGNRPSVKSQPISEQRAQRHSFASREIPLSWVVREPGRKEGSASGGL